MLLDFDDNRVNTFITTIKVKIEINTAIIHVMLILEESDLSVVPEDENPSFSELLSPTIPIISIEGI